MPSRFETPWRPDWIRSNRRARTMKATTAHMPAHRPEKQASLNELVGLASSSREGEERVRGLIAPVACYASKLCGAPSRFGCQQELQILCIKPGCVHFGVQGYARKLGFALL